MLFYNLLILEILLPDNIPKIACKSIIRMSKF